MDRIEEYLEQCFSRFRPTQEVKDLREELLQNARDRYGDYLADGLSAEEAENRVIGSMGDIESLLEEMHAERSSGSADSLAEASREFAEAGKTLAQQFGERFRRQYQSGAQIVRSFHGLKRIILEVTSADISLKSSGSGETVLEAEGATDGLEIAEEDGHVLRIHEQNSASIFSGGLNLAIRIPDASGMAVEIHSLSGDIRMHDIILDSLLCSVTSGDIRVTDSGISSLRISSASGDIRLELDEPAEGIEISTASGDVTLQAASEVRQMQISTASGDMDLKMHGDFERYELKAVSGDIRCLLAGVQAVDFSGTTVTGDLACRKESAAGRNCLSVRTVSGDARIS